MAQTIISRRGGSGGSGTNEVLLDITKGIDKLDGNLVKVYAGGTVEKQSDGAYKLKYNSGAGSSGGNFKLTIPTGYKGFVLRCRDTSIFSGQLYVNATVNTNNNGVTGTRVALWKKDDVFTGLGYYDTDIISDTIGIKLDGSWGDGRSESRFTIEYLALLK